jgi:TfoX/Sxy family transcriptional regulator of competence genes
MRGQGHARKSTWTEQCTVERTVALEYGQATLRPGVRDRSPHRGRRYALRRFLCFGGPADVGAARYCSDMAYDEDLAERIRELVAGEKRMTEKKMFGGLAFLIGGNMAVAASGQGGILVRVDPEQSPKLVSTTAAEPMVMRGKAMDGWLRVGADDVATKRALSTWVKRGVTYARSLPAKR